MVLTKPKKAELEALRKANDREYEDEDEFLTEMFNQVVDLLSDRDSYAVGVRYTESSGVTPYGPFYLKTTASARGKAVGGVLGVNIILQQLKAPNGMVKQEEKNDDGK